MRAATNLDRWMGQICRARIFWVVLALKLLLSAVFGGTNYTTLFIPFLEEFVRHPLANPWATVWTGGPADAFPYGATMLYAMAAPRLVLAGLGLHALPANVLLLVYRLPLLCADLAILLVLGRWLRQRIRLVILLYWANPVLFYINYMHGQLDALPMALALLSAYLLFSARPRTSAILLGLAIAAKMHLLLILPFTLVYLWQERQRRAPVATYAGITAATFVSLNLPYLGSTGFLHMVVMNAQQGKVWGAALAASGGGLRFYVVPAVIAVLFALSLQVQIRNRDLFLFFIGASYGTLLLFIPPAPGWYYWAFPYFIYFYARIQRRYITLFVALQACYFAYFAVAPGSDFTDMLRWPGHAGGTSLAAMAAVRGIDPAVLVSLAFTALQTVLLLNCLVVFDRGVRLPQSRKLRTRPFMLGIAGDSASGKTTVAGALAQLFGEARIGVVCGDDMHRWQRGHERWQELTHLDPRANELHAELESLKQLTRNRKVWRRHYNHDTGRFEEEAPIRPMPVMVFEGLHAFYLKSARDLYDLKVFVKPDPALMLHRKIIRDVARRGSTREKVIATVEQRREDAARYIVAQEPHADITIAMMPQVPLAPDQIGDPAIVVGERLRIALSNEFFLDPLLAELDALAPGEVHHRYEGSDLQVVEFEAPLHPHDVQMLGERHVGAIEQLGIYAPGWAPGWMGLVQLFIAYCMFQGWENDYGD